MSAANNKVMQLNSAKKRRICCCMAICVCLALVLAGCSQAGTTSNGGASKGSEGVSNSDSASSASSKTASSTGEGAVDESDFVGSWEIVQVANTEEGSDENSDATGISSESIESARKKGVDYYVVFNPDGTAVYVLRGVNFYGTWGIEDGFAERGLGTAASVKFSSSTSDGGSMSYIVFIEESKLMMTDGRYVVECEKAADKKPLSKDDYETALEAFIGTWHLTSATRDGVTITKEDGQIATDMTLDFKDDMEVTLARDGESIDAPWGIIGTHTGYVYNPVDGDMLAISDGVLTEDLGEKGTMSFVKE